MSLIYVWIFLILFFSFFSLAPFVPTRTKDLDRINKILNLKKWERFLEIWSWTAKVSIFLAWKNPEAKIYSIELSPFFYIISKINSIIFYKKNLNIIYWNALNMDFSKFDVFYIFWLENTIKQKILPKFEKEAWKNAKLFSYCFNATNNNLKEIKHKNSQKELAIFEYKKNNL